MPPEGSQAQEKLEGQGQAKKKKGNASIVPSLKEKIVCSQPLHNIQEAVNEKRGAQVPGPATEGSIKGKARNKMPNEKAGQKSTEDTPVNKR